MATEPSQRDGEGHVPPPKSRHPKILGGNLDALALGDKTFFLPLRCARAKDLGVAGKKNESDKAWEQNSVN